ncbi:hypothetical protein LSCM1_03954 [Leishmania martiniquensis]|uniref:Uncharacterized protein n=1 Tax=Leishmania martiniquensis TaxID=1580590 RepID=A0A836KJ46_9TRYP|nr:hypothetical protein LSCM1_03954 [Leishmania martiniquensis]
MPKREKEKKSLAPAATTPGLADEERLLEVYLHWDVEAQAAPEVLVLVRLNQHDHFVLPRQLPLDANSDSRTDGQQNPPDPQLSAASPLLLLTRQMVQVGESSARHTLLNDSKANRIDVYALPSAGDGDEAGCKQAGGASGKFRRSATAVATKSKGKAAVGLTALPDGARRIGGTTLSLVPLLTSSSVDIAVPLDAGSLIDADDCLHFRVQCRGSPLLSAQCMSQCRPVLLRVYSVAGLPTLASVSHSSSKDIAAAAASNSRRRLRACVSLAGGRVTVPALPIRPVISLEEATAPTTSPPQGPTAAFHEHVLFLSELGTPLDVYRKLYSAPCEVSLWQFYETDARGTAATAADASLPPEEASGALLGTGGFSVRDFLTDDQTRFSEVVQLLPGRSTVELAKDCSCLTAGCSVSVRLNFFQPFTPLQHVDTEGQPLLRKAFLTRALVHLPYAAPWMADFLTLLLQEVTALPRATQDVQFYLPPQPLPPPTETMAKEKSSGGRSGNAHSRGGGNRKAGKTTSHPAPPDLLPAPPSPSFADELKVYSPPGLSGFEVADGEERVWCFEATVPEVQRVLSRLGGFLEARGVAPSQVRVRFNAELFVPQRAYLSFPPLVIPPDGVAAAAQAPGALDGVPAALEVEPSGTGGRLHRIRLCTAVGTLCRMQSHYIRRTLSDDCLQCLHSLTALRRASSMREAEGRGWMPSAALLIAVERTFGQTLENDDLFGVALATSVSSTTALAAVAAVEDTVEEASGSNAGGAAASLIAEAAVGSLVSFDGMLKAGARRPVPHAVRLRFPVTAWMIVTKTEEEVLCAFPQNTPTDLVRYHIEGQVVRCSTSTLLYVLKCMCLASSITHSHNTAFERVLRRRHREQYALLQERAAASAIGKLMPVQQAAGDAEGCVGSAFHRIFAETRATATSEARGTYSSDDDETDWLDSCVDQYLYTCSASPSMPSALLRRLQPGRASCHGTSAQSTQRKQMPASTTSQTDFAYDKLWHMCEQRARASATATWANGHEKLPRIQF